MPESAYTTFAMRRFLNLATHVARSFGRYHDIDALS
jgi:hypothetical protein